MTRLRPNAPQIRTADAVIEKSEQIFDALEREAITPKTAEQLGQQLKTITNMARMEMQFLGLVLKFGRKAPVPRGPLLRSVIGLPEAISPTDGEYVRKLLPQT